ncbi:MAG: hypothetical protein GX826_06355 [Gammaproteobacteria bacterium]|nr:hypothetical protein [Gammaproteobacteria bacterium]
MGVVGDAARLIAGLTLAVVFLASQSIYSEPFPGCEVRGFLTFQRGCTSWADFLAGFGVVLLMGVVGGRRLHAGLIGLVLVFVLAIFGGLASIQAGEHLYIFENTGDVVLIWRWFDFPILLGGVVAYGLLMLGFFLFHHRRGTGAADKS